MAKIILGSSSTWRQNLAKTQLGIDVELMPPDVDERKIVQEKKPKTPQEHTLLLAESKLNFLLNKVKEEKTIIICCDTIVYFNNEILEKPDDKNECIKQIKSWCKKDSIIEVYTSVAIGSTDPRNVKTTCERADVKMMRDLNDDEIEPYINETQCIKSSGSLVVEYLLDKNAAVIVGDQTVIEGLPIKPTQKMIKEIKQKL